MSKTYKQLLLDLLGSVYDMSKENENKYTRRRLELLLNGFMEKNGISGKWEGGFNENWEKIESMVGE